MHQPRPSCDSHTLPGLLLCGLLAACSSEAIPTGPDSPQGAAEAILTAMDAGEPQKVWDAMPPSWQNDVQALRDQLATQVDAGLYDSAVATANKAMEVLDQKREMVKGLPMINPAMRGQMDAPYQASLDMLRDLLASPLASHSGLQNLDVRNFLETTGASLIKRGRAAAALVPMIPQPPDLENVDFQFLDQEGDRALIAMSHPDGRLEEEIMKRVEGRWVPESLANDWTRQIAAARQWISTFLALPAEQVAAQQARLDKSRRFLDALLLAKNQFEFEANFGNLLGVWR